MLAMQATHSSEFVQDPSSFLPATISVPSCQRSHQLVSCHHADPPHLLMDVPRYPRPLMVTDAAVNRSPDVEVKRDIIQNAIDLAHVMVSTSPASLCYPRWRR